MTRNYTCPGCKKPVHARRVAGTSTWKVFELEKGEPTDKGHGCGYVGPVPGPTDALTPRN